MSLKTFLLVLLGVIFIGIVYDYILYLRRRENKDELDLGDWSKKISKNDLSNASLSEQISNPTLQDNKSNKSSFLANLQPASESDSEFTGYRIEVYSSKVSSQDLVVINLEFETPQTLATLQENLEKQGVFLGYKNLFHKYETNEEEKIKYLMFSVANAKNPGEFTPQNSELPIKSLIFFMDKHRSANAMRYFELMIRTTTIVSNNLNGSLFDNEKNPLTNQKINYIKDTIRQSLVKKSK